MMQEELFMRGTPEKRLARIGKGWKAPTNQELLLGGRHIRGYLDCGGGFCCRLDISCCGSLGGRDKFLCIGQCRCWYHYIEYGRRGGKLGCRRHIQQLPGVQDRGGAQTICALELGNRNRGDQAEMVERIAGSNYINDPGGL